MRNDQSASEVKIKFKTREGFWHKIDEFPDESKNGRKKSKIKMYPKPNPNHVGTLFKDLLTKTPNCHRFTIVYGP